MKLKKSLQLRSWFNTIENFIFAITGGIKMLEEFLQNADSTIYTVWNNIMDGVKVCSFKLNKPKDSAPIILNPQIRQFHFEAFLCFKGSLILGRKGCIPLFAGRQDVLLFSNDNSIQSAHIASSLEGILVAVDGKNAYKTLDRLCHFLGDINLYMENVRKIMDEHSGCLVIKTNPWSRTLFTALEDMKNDERERYVVLKTVEILYLLTLKSSLLKDNAENSYTDNYLNRTITEMHNYMLNHLDEKLTIQKMSRLFNISPTAFKSSFKRMYGQPVHSWLQTERMKKATELLYSSPMTVLSIAQAIGYEGVSQFNLAFKQQFGVTPGQYRKMSNSVKIKPIP